MNNFIYTLYFVVCVVESVCPEVYLSSKKQEVNMTELISKQLASLVTLDISGCDVIHQGVNLITEVLLKAVSLKEFSIANAKLNTATAIKILATLKDVFSLKVLRLNNNDIGDEAANNISAVVSHNHLIEELNISCNKFSTSAWISSYNPGFITSQKY